MSSMTLTTDRETFTRLWKDSFVILLINTALTTVSAIFPKPLVSGGNLSLQQMMDDCLANHTRWNYFITGQGPEITRSVAEATMHADVFFFGKPSTTSHTESSSMTWSVVCAVIQPDGDECPSPSQDYVLALLTWNQGQWTFVEK